MRHRTAALATLIATAVLVAGCSGGSDEEAGSSPDAAPPQGDADPCQVLEDAGYTGADFGPVATWEPLDNVRARVEALSPIVDAPAPDGLEQEWELRIGYIERLRTLVDEADGETLDAVEAQEGDEENAAGEALTDWWFSSCQ